MMGFEEENAPVRVDRSLFLGFVATAIHIHRLFFNQS